MCLLEQKPNLAQCKLLLPALNTFLSKYRPWRHFHCHLYRFQAKFLWFLTKEVTTDTFKEKGVYDFISKNSTLKVWNFSSWVDRMETTRRTFTTFRCLQPAVCTHWHCTNKLQQGLYTRRLLALRPCAQQKRLFESQMSVRNESASLCRRVLEKETDAGCAECSWKCYRNGTLLMIHEVWRLNLQ
jgi:hypothetical protein